ncbi:MAG: FeoB small GTPase domain-containing protein, partial [Candidatus Gallimonas sp.]
MADVRILLVGNPNAGKSTLFNLLTGGHAKVGNWHGVTVGEVERETTIGGEKVVVCDLPGIYTLDAMSMEEKLARDYLLSHKEDAVLFVSECANLDRSLPLLYS